MSDYSYYPGCSLKGTGRPYDESMQAVFAALGLGLDELDDWNCCGATAYMAIDEVQAVALAGRNLALAAATGNDVVAPCNACWLVLTKTQGKLGDDVALRDIVCGALGATCTAVNGDGPQPLRIDRDVAVRHPLDVLINDLGVDALGEAVTRPLDGLKVTPYYGCQIVRPLATFDDQADPQTMDRLLAAVGCEVVDNPYKTRCCGASQMMIMPDVGIDLVSLLIADAVARGAEAIAVACPLCQFNLEGYQRKALKEAGLEQSIPILYFTQLLGLALGLDPKRLGLHRSFVPVDSILGRRAAHV